MRAPHPGQTPRWSGALVLWAAYVVLIPAYVGKSGRLQIADAFLGVALAAHLVAVGPRRGLAVPRVTRPLIGLVAAFALYAVLVAASWSLVLDDSQPLRFASYYIYGAGVIFLAASLYVRFGDLLLRATRFALYVSLLWVAVMVLADPSPGLRSTGPFNNPNQLGFYALLTQSSLWVLACITSRSSRSNDQLGRYAEGVAWIATWILVFASASLGATVGVGLLLLLHLVGRRRVSGQVVVIIMLLVPLVAWTPELHNAVFERIDRQISRSDGEVGALLEERGYDRIAAYPQYLLFGAAEGRTDRFEASALGSELHSSPGTLLFAYGFIGLMLFGAFVLRTGRGAGLVASLPLLPILAYSLSHQGLRFRPWWVFLGLLVIAAAAQARSTDARRAAARETVR